MLINITLLVVVVLILVVMPIEIGYTAMVPLDCNWYFVFVLQRQRGLADPSFLCWWCCVESVFFRSETVKNDCRVYPAKERPCGVVSISGGKCVRKKRKTLWFEVLRFLRTLFDTSGSIFKRSSSSGRPKTHTQKTQKSLALIFVFFVYVFWVSGSHFRKVVFQWKVEKAHTKPTKPQCWGFC